MQTDVLDTDMVPQEPEEPRAEEAAAAEETLVEETASNDAAEAGNEIDEVQALHAAAEAVTPAVEALLFVATEPLETKRIAKLTGEDEKAIALAIQHLEDRYSAGGIVLREVAGGYRLATSSAVREVVEAYLLPPKTSLSTPALETLAIVAHMQPVTKSEIEAIRGVNSDSVVNTLIDRGLIGEAGRKDVVGRPMQYKTTPLFLESFGLNSIDDLPQLELEPGQPLELNLLVPPGESPAASETAADGEPAANEELTAPIDAPSEDEPQAQNQE